VADALGVALASVVGSYFVDNCHAIKITLQGPINSALADEHDMFGARLQAALEQLAVPVFAER
jgi:hypothetical protein